MSQNEDNINTHENECNCPVCIMRCEVEEQQKPFIEQIDNMIESCNEKLRTLIQLKELAHDNPAIERFRHLWNKVRSL